MANTFSHGYALLIGVSENTVARLALPGVAADIAALHQVLLNPERCAYLSENVRALQGSQAASRGIREGLAWLRAKLAADEEATAIVYYSGHGWKDPSDGAYFFMPYDIDSGNLRGSVLPASDFAAEVSQMLPPRLLVLLDCCHAQGMGVKDGKGLSEWAPASLPAEFFMGVEKGVEPTAGGGKGLEVLAQGRGRAVLSSSQGNQPSFMRSDRTMSLFTYHLIEALTGHAAPLEGATEVLVSDIASYVQRHVPESARQMGSRQEPDARINGVFPIALLLGGQGLPKGTALPDPLENLPRPQISVTNRSMRAESHSIQVGGSVTGSTFITGDGNVLNVSPVKADAGPTRQEFLSLLVDLRLSLPQARLDPAEQAVVENDLQRVARESAAAQPDRKRILEWLGRVLSFLSEAAPRAVSTPPAVEMVQKLLNWAAKLF